MRHMAITALTQYVIKIRNELIPMVVLKNKSMFMCSVRVFIFHNKTIQKEHHLKLGIHIEFTTLKLVHLHNYSLREYS